MYPSSVFVVMALSALSALPVAEQKSKPAATVVPASEFSPASTTLTTTATSTTTTPKATTTTPKHTTTTPKATTTTPKPTTTTPKPTTTTPKPTTTTPKPTAPPAPQPTPRTNLTLGNYNLTKDQKVCLMAQMALQIRLESHQANGTFIVQPSMTKATGACKDTTANLTLIFKEGYITFMYNKSAAENTVYVNALSFSFSYPFIKGGEVLHTATNTSVHLFGAKVGHSYSCKNESLYMGNGLYLEVSQDRMQAFNLTKSNEFGIPDHCTADQPDYRVAIAVGVTLLVLIIIVVIAYLLGRRRRTDGYQSL